jgi:hypothetical protein
MGNILLNNINSEYENLILNVSNNYIDLLNEVNTIKTKIIQLELDNKKLHEELNQINGD